MTYKLNRGEYLQITQPAELTGSPIQANKPVAVFGASACMTVPVGKNDCDSAQQQLAPVKALGERVRRRCDIAAAAHRRDPPWRIVGLVDGTILTYDPAPPSGAPLEVNLGQVFEFNTTSPSSCAVRTPITRSISRRT